MQTVLITLVGPARRIDLKLPAEVPVGDLLPKILELCGPRLPQVAPMQWLLVFPSKGVAVPPIRSLQECGVVDGAVLFLQDSASFATRQQQAAAQTFRPQVIQPSAQTGGIGVKWNIPNG
jgi:hypothetical protein